MFLDQTRVSRGVEVSNSTRSILFGKTKIDEKIPALTDEEPGSFELSPVATWLTQTLSAEVPFGGASNEQNDARVEIIDAYARSVDHRQAQYESFTAFFETLIFSLLQVRVPDSSTARSDTAAVTEWVERIRRMVRYQAAYKPSVITADLAAAGTLRLYAAAQADLLERSKALSDHICEVLIRAVNVGLLGTLRWLGPDACRYRHSRLKVELTSATRTTTAESISDKTVRVDATYRHFVERHECHLLHASLVHGVPDWLELPAFARDVVAAVPSYLAPAIMTVDGTLIRERIMECASFETRNWHELKVPVQRPHFDPAILLGNVVLLGWVRSDISWGSRQLGNVSKGLGRLRSFFQGTP